MSLETARAAAAAAPDRTAIRIGRWLFRFRDLLFPLLFFPLALAGEPLVGPGHADRLLDAMGLGLVLLGYGIRALVMGTSYLRRAGRGRNLFADSLAREGLLAHCRNPLYLGNLLALGGLALIRNSLPFYAVALPLFAVVYIAIVLAEEDHLRQRFGMAYEQYVRSVPRLVLRLEGLRHSLAATPFDWRAALRGEYSSAHTGIVAALLLLVCEDFEVGAWPAARPTLFAALAVWLPLAFLYLVILKRKKAGRLGAGYR